MKHNLHLFKSALLALPACIGFAVSAEPITVNVQTAGTLASHISDADKYTITELKVTGPLSNSDIFLLREMAGVGTNETATEGKLVSLDLSGASIVANSEDGVYFDKQYITQKTADNTIGKYMFKGLNLTNVVLPGNITKIDNNAFQGCKITSLSIPESVTTAGSSAFESCTSLTEISLGSITAVTSSTFKDCRALTTVTIPETVASIGDNAFQNCASLKKLTLPASLTSIGFWAFKGSALAELHCLSAVPPTAGYGALEGLNTTTCTLYVPIGASDAYAPAQYWSIFAGKIVEEGTIDPSDPTRKTVALEQAGTLSSKISDEEKWVIEDLTVSGPLNGSDLAFIREMAGIDFSWNKTEGKLVHLDISEADLVFEGTYDASGLRQPLESDYYAYNEATIGSDDPIRMSARQDALPELVFTKTKLEKVEMPNSIKMIYSSFSECYNLKGTVTIPEGVIRIGDYAFEGCSKIEAVVFPSTLEDSDSPAPGPNKNAICAHAFDGCSSLKAITIPSCVTTLRDATFQNCKSLKEIRIPASVTRIGSMVFGNCDNIKELEVESAIPPTASYQAFYGMDKENCVLKVPAGSRDAYKAADEWCEFINVTEEGEAMEFIINVDKAANVKVSFGSYGEELDLIDGKNIVPMQYYKNPLTVTPAEGFQAVLTLNGEQVEGMTVTMGIGYVLDIATSELPEEAVVTFVTESPNGMQNVSITCDGKDVEFADGSHIATLPVGSTIVLAPAEGYKLANVTATTGTDANEAAQEEGKYSILVSGNLTISFEVEEDNKGSVADIAKAAFSYDRISQTLTTCGGRTEIYAATGQLKGIYKAERIDVSGLGKGIYIVKTTAGTFKFIK